MSSSSGGIDVKRVAELARLDLDPERIPALQRDMEAIVEYIDELKKVDVSGVEPTAHAAALSNVWREDRHEASFDRETMLRSAPAVLHGELIRVPRVLPGGEE